ncbi:23S rRNA (pseudouridine(1915)-N(3))-methyltransferase RlmH [Thiotrichales bacterium 19S11-10]|nr:23S rRNA (pseudouridine(1915)-N(3))-methyltransferase RlmH [Thiotrichales bacterium 19S11-10]
MLKINLIALGTKMPQWVETGTDEYLKRLKGNIALKIKELPIAKRTKTTNKSIWLSQEAQSIDQQLGNNDYLITLDSQGKLHSTESLSDRLADWQSLGQDISIIIGGPDGIDQSIKNKASESISLSKMTFPHPLVRIVIVEQLYRALSILKGHPYHK